MIHQVFLLLVTRNWKLETIPLVTIPSDNR